MGCGAVMMDLVYDWERGMWRVLVEQTERGVLVEQTERGRVCGGSTLDGGFFTSHKRAVSCNRNHWMYSIAPGPCPHGGAYCRFVVRQETIVKRQLFFSQD